MTSNAINRVYDAYGHTNDVQACYGSGFTVAASGTTAATVVYPITADPSGTASITMPYGANDSNGLILLTTSGTQTTGSLISIYFSNPYAYVPTGVSVTISKLSDGSTAGGTLTLTTDASHINVSIGTALTTSTKYLLRYTIVG